MQPRLRIRVLLRRQVQDVNKKYFSIYFACVQYRHGPEMVPARDARLHRQPRAQRVRLRVLDVDPAGDCLREPG